MVEKLRFLPSSLYRSLNALDAQKVYEVRVRADKPCRVNYGGCYYYLTARGIAATPDEAIVCSAAQISEIVLRAAEFSIYAYNNQLSGGYITISGGIRIGVAGEVVYEGESVKTQKNFSSLVIRIPHQIIGCGEKAYKSIRESSIKNTLVISPPGCGKTTLLRDLSRLISDSGKNTLLVDERNELAACQNGIPRLNVGANTDVIAGARKNYAFSFGIRSLRPDYIITDELMGEEDIQAIVRAAGSGVNVIASVHARGIDDLKARMEYKNAIESRVFGRYIVLSGVGRYERILDEGMRIV